MADPHPTPSLPPSAVEHRALAAGLFNGCWELLDLPALDADQRALLLHRAHASRYHWAEVLRLGGNAGPTQENVGDWLLSRVYARIGEPGLSRIFGERSLSCFQQHPDIGAFYGGFSHEALARAAALAGDSEATAVHLAAARALAAEVGEVADRDWLLQNLADIAVPASQP